jgi:hypothetical protein
MSSLDLARRADLLSNDNDVDGGTNRGISVT